MTINEFFKLLQRSNWNDVKALEAKSKKLGRDYHKLFKKFYAGLLDLRQHEFSMGDKDHKVLFALYQIKNLAGTSEKAKQIYFVSYIVKKGLFRSPGINDFMQKWAGETIKQLFSQPWSVRQEQIKNCGKRFESWFKAEIGNRLPIGRLILINLKLKGI